MTLVFKNIKNLKQKVFHGFKKDKAGVEANTVIIDDKPNKTYHVLDVIRRKNKNSIRARRKLQNNFSNDDFFDAVSEFSNEIKLTSQYDEKSIDVPIEITKRCRRTEIPKKLNSSNLATLIKVLRSFIGRDLTTVPMPATFFSEPLSLLQRNTESLEYSLLLDKAAECNDSLEQMIYVAAFSISEYSNFYDRKAKPFNPLLNETFEYDRESDYGWRCFAEQVSHHPPRFAMHVESIRGWTLSYDVAVSTKFKGSFIEATPSGTIHLNFKRTNNYYTWKKVSAYVNGLLTGNLWINTQGDVDILNHNTSELCQLKYYPPPSYFSNEKPNRVKGLVRNADCAVNYILEGISNENCECFKVENPQNIEHFEDHKSLKLSQGTLLWTRALPENKFKAMYNFSQFAIELNELEPNVAPTDSRLRPDIRLMEESKWDEADTKKVYLEDKQRLRLKPEEYKPNAIWFEKVICTLTNKVRFEFNYEYWNAKEKQDWKKSPNIFN